MSIDIERLKVDREYWDSQDPTGGEATHYCADGGANPWVKKGHVWEDKKGFWRKARLKNYDMQNPIPRPSPAWDGSGLPVAGTVCRMRLAFRTEDRITITYMGDGVFCYRAENGMEYTGSLSDAAFEPLKTEKERVVDAMMKKWIGSNINVLEWRAREEFLGSAYDAGFLKMPENDHD